MIPKECKRLAEAMLAFIGNFTAWEMSSNPTFVEISRGLVKATVSEGERPKHEMESAIRQLVSRAAYSTDVVDVFAAAGLEKPDISILSDEFLAEVRDLPHRNLAVELFNSEETATQLVLDQAEVLCKDWTVGDGPCG